MHEQGDTGNRENDYSPLLCKWLVPALFHGTQFKTAFS